MARCMHDSCSEEATHALKLAVPDRHCDEVAAEGIMVGIELCFCHAAEAEDNEITPVPGLVAALANVLRFDGAVPDVDSAYITAIEIGCREHRSFMALERTVN